MADHKMTVVGTEGAWQGKCSCKIRSKVLLNRSDAEDWQFHHMREVEKARAGLRRMPSLASQRDWFQTQASDPNVPPADRVLWQVLATEIDHRLNDAHPASEGQATLW